MDTINNLWNGRAGLARTYWGWGILGGFLWGIAISFVTPGSPPAIIVMLAFAAYFTLVSTGTWRAATQYQGNAAWARLAKVAAAFGFVTIGAVVLGLAVVAKNLVVEGRLPTPVPAGKTGAPTTEKIDNVLVPLPTTDKEGKACTQITEFLGECKRQP